MTWKKRGIAALAVCAMTTSAWAAETAVPDDLSWVVPQTAEAVSAEESAEPAVITEEQPIVTEPQVIADQPVQTETSGETEENPDAWKTLLVNRWNPLPEGFTVDLIRLKNGMQVDRRIYNDLDDLLSDCRNAGLHPKLCSAYRSKATQTRLYNNKVARLRAAGYSKEAAKTEAARWVALPDTSEHQMGLALDIVSQSYQGLDKKQESTAEQKWLMEHSWEYGFILRYPSDKGDITGIGYEPWHYRYVGKEAAAAMHASGQCLEEYLAGSPATDETASEAAAASETAAESTGTSAAGEVLG